MARTRRETGFVDEIRKPETNSNRWERRKVSRRGVTGRQRGREESIFILSLTRLQEQQQQQQQHISAPSNLSLR
jgi:hypothetical protein